MGQSYPHHLEAVPGLVGVVPLTLRRTASLLLADPPPEPTQALKVISLMSSIRKGVPFPDDGTRETACQCPIGKPTMFQSWQNLLFLHWAVPVKTLEGHLPQGLRLDDFEGQAWLGIVPFFMRDIRPRRLPAIPGISNFLELNVRTYVYDESGIPGVWFFSLDANRRMACALGRSLFHLPYRQAKMSTQAGEWIDYRALRNGETESADYRYRGIGPDRIAEPGSLEFFLLERYVLYSHEKKKNRLCRARVHHEPYRFHDAEVERFSTAPLAWNHLPLVPAPPDHACTVPRVDVSIFSLCEVGTVP